MKYLFILGRNPELSLYEIECFLEKENFAFDKIKVEGNFFVVKTSEELPSGTIEKLGGVIGIGEIVSEGENFVKDLEKKNIYVGTQNKLNYCIWNFSHGQDYNKISSYLKKRLREEKLKATEKPLTGELDLQDGKKIRISKGNIQEEYFVGENFFGRIFEKSDYEKIEKRDMDKPERREHLAISPRLSKIMINLAKIKEGQTMIDAFCGIGVILSEALLQGINVVGVDKDKDAISGANKNLEWGKFSRENYKIIHGDSRKIKFPKTHAMVSECDLGETIKKATHERKAREIIRNFEKLVIGVLKNVRNSVEGRIVFTSPYIKLFNKKRVGADIDRILSETNLKLIRRFKEYRNNQIVGREIFVLE